MQSESKIYVMTKISVDHSIIELHRIFKNTDEQIYLQIYLIAFWKKIPVYLRTYHTFYHTACILLSPKMFFSEIDLLN